MGFLGRLLPLGPIDGAMVTGSEETKRKRGGGREEPQLGL